MTRRVKRMNSDRGYIQSMRGRDVKSFYTLPPFRQNAWSGGKRRSLLATAHSFLLNIGHWQFLIELFRTRCYYCAFRHP